MKDASSRAAKLSPEQLELLMRRLQEKRGNVEPTKITPHHRQGDIIPLSFAQQRLWFLDRLEPNSGTYNLPILLNLTGPLVVLALEQSLNEILRRHEALRTTFQTLNGQPVQVISPPLAVALPLINLSDRTESEQKEALQHLIDHPFDLARGPLWSATLLRLNEMEHILFLNIHHIVFDDWSSGVLLQELAALYEAFMAGQPSPLAELPIQYADFSIWQRQWLQGNSLENQLSYWKQQLANAPTVLNLPLDHSRLSRQTYQGDRHPILLPLSLTKALKDLARQEGATLFMVLLAAFQTLLYRYTHQQDIIVGSPIANRTQVETEGLIGFFVNTLPLRTNLSGNPSFRTLLNRVREVALGAYTHQTLPFEKLVEELHPERHLNHNPLVQVLFVLQTAPKSTLDFADLKVDLQQAGNKTAKFDLMLELQETSEGLSGWFEYKTELFEADTIARMVGHFQTLLEGIVANPDQQLAELPLLADREREQLLVEWNATQTSYPLEQGIHQLFEQQVEQSPDAIAVMFADQHFTYRELNQRANQLAHSLQNLGLQNLGAGAEVRVGICMERSLEMAVAVVAVLKAGGAYVPLDPTYPSERLALMLADAQVSVLLTQERLLSVLPCHTSQVVCLSSTWDSYAHLPQNNLQNTLSSTDTPNKVAYIIYTSGSTGKPKGVVMPHRPLVNLILWQTAHSTLLDHPLKTLQFASLSFDVSFQEMFATWCSGGTLILTTEEVRRAPKKLLAYLTENGVERLFLPYVALQQLAEVTLAEIAVGASLAPTALREVITAGEQLQITRSIANFFSALPNCTLRNQYGPSESHVVTECILTGSPSQWSALPSIGRPIANTHIYILNQQLQPVPIGVVGELYIGGVALACGYLDRPEITAEKFISDPFSTTPGGRLYKTGDLARYQRNGNIDFLGRTDHQVKVRGFRIELGEIEAVLGQHRAVKAAVVVVRGEESGEKRLVAYIVLHPEQPITTDDLRYFLKQKFPEYLVPSAFAILEALPLTPNGKVDRRALPALESFKNSETTYAPPQDQLELQLVKIWEHVLGIRPIGVNDNFFDLGGHSLLAVRLFAHIQKTLGQDFPLATLFQAPTIQQFAQILRQEGWSAPWSSLVPIQPNGTKLPFFCVHGAGGNVLGFQALAEELGPDQPFFGLQAEGLDGQQISRTTVEEIAAHYLKEIQTVQPEGPYCLGGFSAGGLVAFEMAQQLRAQGQEVGLLVLLDTQLLTEEAPYRLDDRLALHWKKLAKQGPTYGLKWIAEKVEKVRHQVERMVRGGYFKSGRSLPLSLRRLYILDTNQAIIKAYQPKPYPGRIDYFYCTEWEWFYPIDPQATWGPLASELSVYEVPVQHLNIVAEYGAQVLAAQLKTCLNEVNTV